MIFSTVFKDDDDIVIGKVFMQVRLCSLVSSGAKSVHLPKKSKRTTQTRREATLDVRCSEISGQMVKPDLSVKPDSSH